MAEMHAGIVPVGSAVELPGPKACARASGCGVANLPRGDGQNLHHVAIAKVRIGFQHQADDTACNRRCRRRATEGRCVVTGTIARRAGIIRGRDAQRAAIRR